MMPEKDPVEQKSLRDISPSAQRVSSVALLVVISTTLLIVLVVIGVALYACGIQ